MAEQRDRLKSQADVVQLSFDFAVNVVKAVGGLPRTTTGFELGRQVIRSGTSIGANVEEAQGARTKPEFIHSMNIAKREARETRFWLRVLGACRLLKQEVVGNLIADAERLIRILTAIVRTAERHYSGRRSSIIQHPASSISSEGGNDDH